MELIGVQTEDSYLFRKIQLELYGKAEVIRIYSDTDAAGCELIFKDAGDKSEPLCNCPILTIGKSGADVPLPLPIGYITALISGKHADKRLRFCENTRDVTLASKRIRLTELEYSLLRLLADGGGEFVSREKISADVWQGKAENGLINIYIHYLREKLECDGEKIILSSRKCGYAIDKKYLGGGGDADAD